MSNWEGFKEQWAVAGKSRDKQRLAEAAYQAGVASQPHPTGDTQQEAAAFISTDGELMSADAFNKMNDVFKPIFSPLFRHPPDAQFALEELCDRIIREAVKAVEQAAGNNWEYCGEVAKLTNAIFELRTTLNRDKSGVGRFIPDSECKQGKCMNATTGCQDACKFPPEYSATLNQHSYANGVDTPNGKD